MARGLKPGAGRMIDDFWLCRNCAHQWTYPSFYCPRCGFDKVEKGEVGEDQE